MKTMVERNDVLHRHRVQGQSYRQISREMGMSRKTVRKIIEEYQRVCIDENGMCDIKALELLEGSKPRYATPRRECTVMTDAYKAIIRECLEENRVKRATKMGKLQMNCKDILARLVKEGYTGSYASVCLHVGRIRGAMEAVPPPKDVFVRREHDPGMECEFDWGEVPLRIAGKPVKAQLAVFSLLHSNVRHASLHGRQDTVAFMESHRTFFEWAGGVPRFMVYDNMKVAVTIKGKGRGRPCQKFPTASMRRLSLHYKFTERFCNARSGWEKGTVERSVEVVRHAAFVIRQEFGSWEEAQAYLDNAVAALNAESLTEGISNAEKQVRRLNDMAALQPAPYPMGCWEAEERTPDKYCTISVDSNHYSVPEELIDKTVTVRLQSTSISIWHEGKKVAVHERLEGKGQWHLNLEHYLSTLLRKPGAIDSSTALRQIPDEMRQLYERHFRGQAQLDFIKLLIFAKERAILHSQITRAARKLTLRGIHHITADHLKVELQNTGSADNCIQPPLPDSQRAQIQQHATEGIDELTKLITT